MTPLSRSAGHSVEVVIVPDATAGGELIAEAIAALVRRKPDALLGVATGSTPLPIYQALAAKVRSGAVDASRARICQLDEYVGLPAGPPRVLPLGRAARGRRAARAVARSPSWARTAPPRTSRRPARRTTGRSREAGGVDLQLLGIGTDGHIGFNEPCSSLASRTRIKTLTEQTRVDNARFFDDDIDAGAAPRHHPGHRHHPGGPPPGAAGHRRGQGRRGGRDGRGAGRLGRAGLGAAAAPARHGGGRRGRGVQAEAGGLLPRHVRGQAASGRGCRDSRTLAPRYRRRCRRSPRGRGRPVPASWAQPGRNRYQAPARAHARP